MTGDRRAVRTTPSFFEDLDAQLGSERGPNGEPSVNDFQVFELLRVVEVFATRWNELPALIPGRSDYRILIATGMLVALNNIPGRQFDVANGHTLPEPSPRSTSRFGDVACDLGICGR